MHNSVTKGKTTSVAAKRESRKKSKRIQFWVPSLRMGVVACPLVTYKTLEIQLCVCCNLIGIILYFTIIDKKNSD